MATATAGAPTAPAAMAGNGGGYERAAADAEDPGSNAEETLVSPSPTRPSLLRPLVIAVGVGGALALLAFAAVAAPRGAAPAATTADAAALTGLDEEGGDALPPSCGAQAGEYTCGERIHWLLEHDSALAALTAAEQVAEAHRECEGCRRAVTKQAALEHKQLLQQQVPKKAGANTELKVVGAWNPGESGAAEVATLSGQRISNVAPTRGDFFASRTSASSCPKSTGKSCLFSPCPSLETCSWTKRCECASDFCAVNGKCTFPFVADLACEKNTGGSCYMGGCDPWRRAQCESFQCVCPKNFCNRDGRCMFSLFR
eukprot:TRINITY_DN46083_c0_g1_i1.p2 TRINITY_DN46083_c0_g1~~TRINITY_DN46083_c0_g1_i1.p2  ORF type:complete len:336 (-),score=76.30 TRINITY_DN46083_c0_g1_i1:52-996(-)